MFIKTARAARDLKETKTRGILKFLPWNLRRLLKFKFNLGPLYLEKDSVFVRDVLTKLHTKVCQWFFKIFITFNDGIPIKEPNEDPSRMLKISYSPLFQNPARLPSSGMNSSYAIIDFTVVC